MVIPLNLCMSTVSGKIPGYEKIKDRSTVGGIYKNVGVCVCVCARGRGQNHKMMCVCVWR